MWVNKIFKTQARMDAWLDRNRHCIQYEVIFVNNAYGITYRKLVKVGMPR